MGQACDFLVRHPWVVPRSQRGGRAGRYADLGCRPRGWPTPSPPQRPAPRTPSAHRRRPQQLVSSVRLRLQPERVARSSAPSHPQPSRQAACSAPRPRRAADSSELHLHPRRAAFSELLPRRRVASSAPCRRRAPQGPASSAEAGCLARRRRPPRAGCSARLPPRWAVGSSARPLLRSSNNRRPRRRPLLRPTRRSSPSSCSRWRWPPLHLPVHLPEPTPAPQPKPNPKPSPGP